MEKSIDEYTRHLENNLTSKIAKDVIRAEASFAGLVRSFYDILPGPDSEALHLADDSKIGQKPADLINILDGFEEDMNPEFLVYENVRKDIEGVKDYSFRNIALVLGGAFAGALGVVNIVDQNLYFGVPLMIAAAGAAYTIKKSIGGIPRLFPSCTEYEKLISNARSMDNFIKENYRTQLLEEVMKGERK